MDRQLGEEEIMVELISDSESESSPVKVPKWAFESRDFSPDLFPSVVDLAGDTSQSAAKPSFSSAKRNTKLPKVETGAGPSSIFPSVSTNEDINNAALSVVHQVSDTMLKLFEKLHNRIDTNAVDMAQLVREDRDRIRDLERRVLVVEDEQQKMKMLLRKMPTASPPDLAQATVAPQNQAPTFIQRARVRDRIPRPCDICGKVLSVPYVYVHQKTVHRK